MGTTAQEELRIMTPIDTTERTMKLRTSLVKPSFVNKNLNGRLERKGTKMTSKLHSDNTNKSFEFINRDDQLLDDKRNINFRMFQESAKREEKLHSREEEKHHPDSLRVSLEKNQSFEPESCEEEHVQLDNVHNEIEIIHKKVKRHGWIWPLHLYQVLTWILGAADTLYLFIEVFPFIEHLVMFIILMLVFFSIAPILAFLDVKLILSDPTDPVVYEERIKIQKLLQQDNSEVSHAEITCKFSKYNTVDTREFDSEFVYVCDICLTHVQERTKHWRECNRWVSTFDHHCKWLNNWIGDQNYKPFMWLISMYLVSNIYFWIMYIIHLINIIRYKNSSFELIYKPAIDEDSIVVKIILWWIMLLLKLIIIFLNSHLIIMHIYLHVNKMTTYEWIVRRKRNNKVADNNDEDDDNVNSNSAMSRRDSKPSSLRLYRSKIVHRAK